LPFFCVLTTSPQVSEQLGKRHKTVAMWAQQMISLVRRWLPDRSIKLMGDTAYSGLELGLHAQQQRVTLVTTGRLDAVLHEPPPQRTSHTIGRPRVVGKRLPALEQVLQDARTRLPEAHPGLVGRRRTNCGGLHRHSPVGPLWL
jgi:hypothetical protein